MRGDGINWRGSSGFEAGANFRKLALHMASMVSRTTEYLADPSLEPSRLLNIIFFS